MLNLKSTSYILSICIFYAEQYKSLIAGKLRVWAEQAMFEKYDSASPGVVRAIGSPAVTAGALLPLSSNIAAQPNNLLRPVHTPTQL